MHRFLKYSVVFIIAVTGVVKLSAQDIEPWSYATIPKGLNAAAISYSYTNGNVIADATSPIKDLKVSTSVPAATYLRTFSLFNKLGRVGVTLPFILMNGNAKIDGRDTSGKRTGFADARLRFGINLLGGKAIAPKDFKGPKPKTVLGTSLVVSVPIGQYYGDKLINLGNNRWGIKPEVGFSYSKKHWYFETYAGVWFFTNNNEFLQKNQLTQKPLMSLQGHVSYLFTPFIWVAVNAGYANGGETFISGTSKNNDQHNLRLGGTFSMAVSRQSSFKALVNTGVTTTAGSKFNLLTLVYQYTWF